MVYPRGMNAFFALFTSVRPPVRFGAAVAFTLLTTVLLLQSSRQPLIGPATPDSGPDLALEILLTLGHIVVFGGLVLLWTWALRTRTTLRTALVIAVAFAVIYGLTTEFLQSAVPDRSASPYDVAVNTLSALVMARAVWRHAPDSKPPR